MSGTFITNAFINVGMVFIVCNLLYSINCWINKMKGLMDYTRYDEDVLKRNIDKIHTTPLGLYRIRKNLGLDENYDVISLCKKMILSDESIVSQGGKNWYVGDDDVFLAINASNYCVITAHPKRELGK